MKEGMLSGCFPGKTLKLQFQAAGVEKCLVWGDTAHPRQSLYTFSHCSRIVAMSLRVRYASPVCGRS